MAAVVAMKATLQTIARMPHRSRFKLRLRHGPFLNKHSFGFGGAIYPMLSSCHYCTSGSSQLSLSHPSVQRYLKTLVQDEQRSESSGIISVVKAIMEKQEEIRELIEMGKENPELRESAEVDVKKVQDVLKVLEGEFFSLVVEPDKLDFCTDVILEVSAGAGGQEAMLFTSELFDMYSNYANFRGWESYVVDLEGTEIGGVRHGSLAISGPEVYKTLKFEGGVHRVQRVPKTEKSGRIHTSTATVAILPTPKDVEVNIDPQDLKIETKRASGAGGQHVNKTESAVRITHVPTGIVVDCQTERSQVRNRSSAMKTLQAKLYQRELDKQVSSIKSSRKLQVGSGNRNEKIRTYNYVQDRVTDHRIGLTVHNLKGILEGYEALDNVICKLQNYDQQERLEELFK